VESESAVTVAQEDGRVADVDYLQSRVYSLPPGTTIINFDSATNKESVLVVSRGKYYEVSGLASRILLSINICPKTLSEISHDVSAVDGVCPSRESLQHTLDRMATLVDVGDSNVVAGASMTMGSRKKRQVSKSYFAVRLPLLPSKYVRSITRLLSPVMAPSLMIWLGSVLFLLQSVFWYLHRGLLESVPKHLPGGIEWVLLAIASYAGLFLHELGHATACRRQGVKHGPIGFAIYLIFPALYTDVTDAWRLPRRGRIQVDSGGIYMSLIAATTASYFFVLTHLVFWAILVWIYDFTVIANLIPFVRMDGYWIISDILGISNLMAANLELTTWLLCLVAHREHHRPRVLRLKSKLKWPYLIYYLLFLVFCFISGAHVCIRYLPYWLHSFPGQLEYARAAIAHTPLSIDALMAVVRLTLATIPIIGITLYALRLIRRLAQRAS